ncbi:hypothetical protein T492DRAFT_1089028 [Pavlovales sp. CCMP2436]|nr:hypothetical protein T492DRAFT_1089028 [Pavlovales sp. CCMP2436]
MHMPKVVGVLVSGEVVAIVRSQNVFSQTVGSVSEYEIRGRNTAACREARGAVEEGGSIPGSRIRARALVLGRHHAKLAVAVAHRLHDYREVALSDHVERRPAHAVAQAELARGHLVHLPHGCLAVPPLVLLAPRLGLRFRRRCRSSRGRGFGLVRSVELQGDDEREV